MKTLATCNPKEFLIQSNKIRKSVASWLSLTQVLEIRQRHPEIMEFDTEEQKQEAIMEQVQKNLSDMLDAVLGEYPEETAELLGLMCFVDPKDLDKHTMIEFLPAVTELIRSPEIINFFISLAQLGKRDISSIAKV